MAMVGIAIRQRDMATGRGAWATTFYTEVSNYANAWFSPEHA
jgi:hypothetical protein